MDFENEKNSLTEVIRDTFLWGWPAVDQDAVSKRFARVQISHDRVKCWIDILHGLVGGRVNIAFSDSFCNRRVQITVFTENIR